MKVFQVMTPSVRIAHPDDTLQTAAQIMCEYDFGFLPVGQNDRLVGMITDRDIAVRAVARDKGPDTPVREVMSTEVRYCFVDDDIDDVAQNMADLKVRRLPVLNPQKRIVGILSLGDIALASGADPAGDALCEISEPGGAHSQAGPRQ